MKEFGPTEAQIDPRHLEELETELFGAPQRFVMNSICNCQTCQEIKRRYEEQMAQHSLSALDEEVDRILAIQ